MWRSCIKNHPRSSRIQTMERRIMQNIRGTNTLNRNLLRWVWLVALIVAIALYTSSAAAQNYIPAVLHAFTGTGGDGASPEAGLVMDASGNLYGTTASGGADGYGAVFKLPTGGGVEVILHSFTGSGGDGANPEAGLVMDASGNLYGTTASGGAGGYGTVFKVPSIGGVEVILHSFTGSGGDGASPHAGLVIDASGNLYGTTTSGGADGYGTVFTVPSGGGVEATLYSFTGSGSDGARPEAGLILDGSGNLYGTTASGGAYGYGTIFKLPSGGGLEAILYDFTGSGGDGASPQASLVMDASGNLYGTTGGGGANGYGTVFKLSSGGGTEVALYSFSSSDGAEPFAGLILDGSGNLYGTTALGGSYGSGTAFELVNNSGTYGEKILHNFIGTGGDGNNPDAGLIADSSGNLYGTTFSGGSSTHGTVFELVNTPAGTVYSTTVALASAPNPGTAGNPISITVTISSPIPNEPATGTVGLYNGATLLATQRVAGGTSFSFSDAVALGIGTNTLTVQYAPDVSYLSASSGSLNVTVLESGVATTNGSNTFMGNQTVNGTLSATAFTGNGAGLTGVNASGLVCTGCVGNAQLGISYAAGDAQNGNALNALMLGGLPAGNFATNGANNFTGNQNMPSLTVTGPVAGGPVTIGGGTPIAEYESVTQSISLPALSAGACTKFTSAPLTGFAPGQSDTVALGLPKSIVAGLGANIFLMYEAWESSSTPSPTIVIRVCNPSAVQYKGGDTGTVRIDIFKH
jgi:uncharacterized repeat protein (TIGR03803 family)